MLYDVELQRRVHWLRRGETIYVETVGQYQEAKRIIRVCRPFDGLKVEMLGPYDGRKFIIRLAN